MRSLTLLASTTTLSLACFHAEPSADGDSGSSDGSGTTGTTAPTSSTDTTASTSGPSSTSVGTTDSQDSSGSADASATGPDSTGGVDCAEGEMACGDECVDLQSNASHCGACDHDCLGGECEAGTCQAVQLASGKGRLFMVQLSDDFVYYGGDGTDVWRIYKDGTADTMIATDELCYDSAITDTHVIWGNDWLVAENGIRGCEVPDCPGDAGQIVPGTNLYAMTFNAENSTLYFNQGGDIMAKIWPAGAQVIFATASSTPYEIENDGGFVYWTDGDDVNGYRVRRQAVMNGMAASLATGRPESISALAAGATSVLWAEYDGSGNILAAPLPNGIGGGDPTVIGTVGGDVYEIVVDDEHVYWVAQGIGAGSVQRCPIAGCGGMPEILEATDFEPWSIALDDVAAYWVTENGSVWKIAK